MDIKAGQVWRNGRGDELTIEGGGTMSGYPWIGRYASGGHDTFGENGRYNLAVISDLRDLRTLITDVPNVDVWFDWTGGTQPQHTRDQGVEIQMRGFQIGPEPVDANRVRWLHDGSEGDVVRYRLIATSEITEDDKDFVDSSMAAFVVSSSSTQTGKTEAAARASDVDEFAKACYQHDHPYHLLAATLLNAFLQASSGKGKERHATGATPFHEQPMATINRQLGSVDGFIYQAHKKSLEAKRLPDGRAQAELLGSINYLAGAVIALDTWAKKESV